MNNNIVDYSKHSHRNSSQPIRMSDNLQTFTCTYMNNNIVDYSKHSHRNSSQPIRMSDNLQTFTCTYMNNNIVDYSKHSHRSSSQPIRMSDSLQTFTYMNDNILLIAGSSREHWDFYDEAMKTSDKWIHTLLAHLKQQYKYAADYITKQTTYANKGQSQDGGQSANKGSSMFIMSIVVLPLFLTIAHEIPDKQINTLKLSEACFTVTKFTTNSR